MHTKDLTLTFTPDEIHTLLGALNSGSIKRRADAKRRQRYGKVAEAQACADLAKDQDDMFVRIVRARQAMEG